MCWAHVSTTGIASTSNSVNSRLFVVVVVVFRVVVKPESESLLTESTTGGKRRVWDRPEPEIHVVR